MDTSETYIKVCDCEEIQLLRSVGEPYKEGDWRKPADDHHRELIVPLDKLPKDRAVDWYNDPKFTKPITWMFPVEVVERESGWDDSCHYPMPERQPLDIWLPRQDQLQEMVDDQVNMLLNFGYFVFAVDGSRYLHVKRTVGEPDPTMEQLWLAFVMKEKFNKVWDGEQWIIGN